MKIFLLLTLSASAQSEPPTVISGDKDGVFYKAQPAIENSIILEECTIEDIGSRIGNSLMGRNVTVSRNTRPPRAYEFMVGDNSNIILF